MDSTSFTPGWVHLTPVDRAAIELGKFKAIPAPRLFCLQSDSEPAGTGSRAVELTPREVVKGARESVQFLKRIGFVQSQPVAVA